MNCKSEYQNIKPFWSLPKQDKTKERKKILYGYFNSVRIWPQRVICNDALTLLNPTINIIYWQRFKRRIIDIPSLERARKREKEREQKREGETVRKRKRERERERKVIYRERVCLFMCGGGGGGGSVFKVTYLTILFCCSETIVSYPVVDPTKLSFLRFSNFCC